MHKTDTHTQACRQLIQRIRAVEPGVAFGHVTRVQGLLAHVSGPGSRMALGSRCLLHSQTGQPVLAEVTGFDHDQAMVMAFGDLAGIGPGCRADFCGSPPPVYPDTLWKGRVLNAHAHPLDDKGPLPQGPTPCPLLASPPPAHKRNPVGPRMDLGVRSINTFVTCCEGQRLGIFAGSGVGKSVLLSMLTRQSLCDVVVVGLIGERGREVHEFVHRHLGPEGLARSVLVVATSDESPLMRRQAAWLTLTVAEFFRNQGQNVLCLMDSVTRFAMALRDIGLAAGEPPTTRGYTPSVFAGLPRLLERAGPGAAGQGSITGLFTVLVEGDDHNEPVADTVRGILDGHIVLDRFLAEQGRYPPVHVLKSISRTLPDCQSPEEQRLVAQARRLLGLYDRMAELIRIGAWQPGQDALMDEAVRMHEPLEAFLTQPRDQPCTFAEGFRQLAALLSQPSEREEPLLENAG